MSKPTKKQKATFSLLKFTLALELIVLHAIALVATIQAALSAVFFH